MAKYSIKVEGFDPVKIKSDLFKNDNVGRFMAQSVARHTGDYVPFLYGQLFKNYVIESFKITYESEYANRQWNGVDFNFTKDKHPKATHHWTEIGFEKKKDVILQEIEDFIKNGR